MIPSRRSRVRTPVPEVLMFSLIQRGIMMLTAMDTAVRRFGAAFSTNLTINLMVISGATVSVTMWITTWAALRISLHTAVMSGSSITKPGTRVCALTIWMATLHNCLPATKKSKITITAAFMVAIGMPLPWMIWSSTISSGATTWWWGTARSARALTGNVSA